MKHFFLVLLTLVAGLYWASCHRSDEDPCNDESYGVISKGNTYNELDTTYLKYFPYNEAVKELKFLYTNDTVTNDTITYRLLQSKYVDTIIGGSGVSNCDTTFTEIIRHHYKCITPKYANRKPMEEFSFVIAHNEVSFLFSFTELIDKDWWAIQIDADLYDRKHPNYVEELVSFNNVEFRDVYVDNSRDFTSWYNSTTGFIRIELKENFSEKLILQSILKE